LSLIVATSWVNHEGLGFDGRSENSITMKTIFVNEKYMLELDFSSREGSIALSEGENTLSPQIFCGISKERNNEESS
jgi:hypothetical protein